MILVIVLKILCIEYLCYEKQTFTSKVKKLIIIYLSQYRINITDQKDVVYCIFKTIIVDIS